MSKDKLNDAISAIRGWYYSAIRSLADSAIEDCKKEKHDDEYDARQWLTERIDQDTDGHEFAIYAFKAQCVCLASDNEDAYEDELGEKPPSVEEQACMAMRADVWELLNAREDEWLPTQDEDESEAV